MLPVAVLGAGSWGTTFAKVLADAGNDVALWARRPALAEAIAKRHRNSWSAFARLTPEFSCERVNKSACEARAILRSFVSCNVR